MSENINNLVNITPKMPYYNVIADKIIEFIKKNMKLRDDEDQKLAEQLLNSPQIKYIAGDTYFLHYSIMPIIRTNENPDRLLETARKIFKKYSSSDEYRKLRVLTKLNDQLSRIYSTRMSREIVIQLLREIPPEKKQQLVQLMSGQQNGSGNSQAQGQGSNNQSSDQSQGNQQNNVQEKLQQALNEALQSISPQKMHSIIRRAMRRAKKQTEIAHKVAELMGGKGAGGTWAGKSPGSIDDLYDISDKIMNTYAEIISLGEKIYSKMPVVVNILKKRGTHGDIYGYTKTHKLQRALPRELALPDELFYSKLAGNGFTSREHYSIMEGSYYVLLDKSGSMDGEKTIWARSVALAIYKLAKKKGRKFYLRFFDYEVYDLVDKPSDIIRMITTVRSNGGTDITNALRTAIEDMRKNKLNIKTNTIILITDGEDRVDTSLIDQLKKNNIQLVVIMIQGHNEDLQELARASGGHYMKAELTEEGALKVVSLAK